MKEVTQLEQIWSRAVAQIRIWILASAKESAKFEHATTHERELPFRTYSGFSIDTSWTELAIIFLMVNKFLKAHIERTIF
jgi:hypothetical protein